MILRDVGTAVQFFRLLRAARGRAWTGHVWYRVDVKPGRPATVQPRRYTSVGPYPPGDAR